MKHKLVEKEDPNTGPVSMSRIDKEWIFTKTVQCLTLFSVLDDIITSNMRVIIPIYLIDAHNCVASSKLQHVCCIDGCDALVSPACYFRDVA